MEFIIILICVCVLFSMMRKDARKRRPTSAWGKSSTPLTYHIDLSVVPKEDFREKSPEEETCKLEKILSRDQIARIDKNLEHIMQRHGSEGFFVIEMLISLADEEFFESHGPLLIGDEVVLHLGKDGMTDYGDFKLVSCSYAEDGSPLSLVRLTREMDGFTLLESRKITGSYVGDMEIVTYMDLPPQSHKIIVFYKTDDGGDEERDPIVDPVAELEKTLVLMQGLRQFRKL